MFLVAVNIKCMSFLVVRMDSEDDNLEPNTPEFAKKVKQSRTFGKPSSHK